MKFSEFSRNDIVAHLRLLLRSLSEQYASVKRDDVRTEMIWTNVEQTTQQIDAYLDGAAQQRNDAIARASNAEADVRKGHEVIAGLNKSIIEMQTALRDGVPNVILAVRNVGNQTKHTKTRVERIQYGTELPAFVIWQYDDNSGFVVSVRIFDNYDGDYSWYEGYRWYYLHKPSGAELMARLTTTKVNDADMFYVQNDNEE